VSAASPAAAARDGQSNNGDNDNTMDEEGKDDSIFGNAVINAGPIKPANAAIGSGTGINQQVLTTAVENLPGDNSAASVANNSCDNAASQGSVLWGKDSHDQCVIEAMDATNIVGSQPWSETTTEGKGDLYAAPVSDITKEPEIPEVKVDFVMPNDPTGKKA
jgi:hypothetical protein